MDKHVSPKGMSSLLRGIFVLTGVLVAAGAISPAFSAKGPLTRAQVKKIAKQQANKQITTRAPGLSVANANTLEGKPASAFASSTSEPYHEVGAPGEPGFENGWGNVGGGFSTAAFYKDPLGVVHLKGDIARDPDGPDAFTLPPGYRPSQMLFMPAAGGGPSVAILGIDPDGSVQPNCAGAGLCIIGIDGLTFRAG